MKQDGNVIWKTKIPKKLYNKINYFRKRFGISRSYFLNYGIDHLQLKYEFYNDFPDPDTLFPFSDAGEADTVTWQVELDESEARAYDDFIKRYGVTGRDVLAASLYAYQG